MRSNSSGVPVKTLLTFAVLATAAIVIALSAPRALACSCTIPETVLLPQGSAPPNTKIWIVGYTAACEALTLVDEQALSVPVRTEELGDRLTVLIPEPTLSMGGRYRVECVGPYSDPLSTEFVVVEVANDSAPPLPRLSISDTQRGGGRGDTCGDWQVADVTVEHEGALVVMDIARQADLNAEELRGSVVDAFVGERRHVGDPVCESGNWDFDSDGTAPNIRVGVFDLAGNFSGWTAGQDVEPAGCSISGAPASAFPPTAVFALLAFVTGLLLRRRPPTRRES